MPKEQVSEASLLCIHPSIHSYHCKQHRAAVSSMNIAGFGSVFVPPPDPQPTALNHHHLLMTQPFDP